MLLDLELPAGSLEVVDLASQPENDRVTVLVEMAHLPQYGLPATQELVYGCRFPVAVGDLVRLPGTNKHPAEFVGMITALDGNGYRGPVKYVIGKVKKESK